jgi:3-deoxy-D-manno-octulosonic-acid transferase
VRRPFSLAVYGVATGLIEPLAPTLLKSRARAGKEDAARLGERLGKAAAARPDGPVAWLHGASVGETLSLLPLIERWRRQRPDLALLVTSGTTTSAELLARRLPPGVIHQYAPIDGPAAAGRFLDHWRPGLAVFAESEFWPNLILGAKARGARLALISARITAKSAEGWARAPAAARALMQAFDLILPQDKDSAGRIERLGGRAGPILNMKFAAEPLDCDAAELKGLKAQIGRRRVVLAASTHTGEEELIASAAAMIRDVAGRLLLIIAPRHPQRGPEIAAALGKAGTLAQRSAGQPIGKDTQVYLADTLGEMGLLYRLADVAVMGGSFTDGIGGHNPLEPARLGVPVISGPDIANFRDVYGGLIGQGGARIAETEIQLAGDIADLLADPKGAGAIAQAYVLSQGEHLEAALRPLDALLPS